MRKETSLPVRLETEQRERLYRVCEELGLTPSIIVRMLVKSLCEYADRNKGKVEFPLTLK